MKFVAVILAFICIVTFVAGCSCPLTPSGPEREPAPGIAPAPEDALELARKFCPVIYLNGEPDSTENFQPDAVQLMVDLSLLRDLSDPAFNEKPSIPDFLRWFRSDYYLDIVDLGPDAHTIAEYKAAYESIKGNYRPTVYARVREMEDYTLLQYWLFYYMNDWRNVHEGDWELVQLQFPAMTTRQLLDNSESPLFAAYSQHQAGQRMSWSEMEAQGLVEDTHPFVYVAQGSHANYFTPGQFWSGLDFDNTGLTSWRIIPPQDLDVVLMNEEEAEKGGTEWLQFQGYWGQYVGFSVSVLGLSFRQRGPYGPQWSEAGAVSKKWQAPIEWAAGLPEYPKPFWVSFLSIPGDLLKLAVFSLFSPADLHVYDSQGNHVGLDELGKLENTIPGAIFISPEGTDYKTILIPDADVVNAYTVVVNGTDTGTMDLKAQVPDTQLQVKRFLEYLNVPLSSKTRARAAIQPVTPRMMMAAPEIAAAGPEDVIVDVTTLEIDSDGDGTFETQARPGNFAEQRITRQVLNAEVAVASEMLDPAALPDEKYLTARIELPAGLNPEQVDLSSVMLFGEIPARLGLADVADDDRDGIFELVVKFERQVVLDYLAEKSRGIGVEPFTITGTINGQPFKGSVNVDITERLVERSKR